MKKFFEHISRYTAGAATGATYTVICQIIKKKELLENKKIMESINNSVEVIKKSNIEMQDKLNQENIEKLTSLSNN
jgi:hypothetical protein